MFFKWKNSECSAAILFLQPHQNENSHVYVRFNDSHSLFGLIFFSRQVHSVYFHTMVWRMYRMCVTARAVIAVALPTLQ